MDQGGDLLTLKEVAARLKVSERTVRELVRAGKLSRPRRVDRAPRWFPQDLDVYLWRLARGDFEPPKKGRAKPGNSG